MRYGLIDENRQHHQPTLGDGRGTTTRRANKHLMSSTTPLSHGALDHHHQHYSAESREASSGDERLASDLMIPGAAKRTIRI
jgi:hypothetical protein